MSGRKLVLMAALVLPSLALMSMPGSASASKVPPVTGTGSVTCTVQGGVSFNPPLTQSPSPAGRGLRQDVEVNLQFTDCSGPDANTPQPNPTSATVSVNAHSHLKDTKVEFMGHMDNGVGGCGYSDFDPVTHVGNRERWAGGPPLSVTHTELQVNTTGGSVSGTSTGSYAGGVSGQLNLDASSAEEYDSVCNGSGDGSISYLDFDPSTSSLTVGQPAP
jgi:hypothetical protein